MSKIQSKVGKKEIKSYVKKNQLQTEEWVHQIYDKIFKRIFSLSALAIINLINGLFETEYPLESTVEYLRSEFTSITLNGRFADVIIVIAGKYHYHLEAQTDYNEHIILRVFEYGFYQAIANNRGTDKIKFPQPIVIYLKGSKGIPKTSKLLIDFGKQGQFLYKVENYIYAEHTIQELNQKKMVVLIPFHMLKLQDLIKKAPTKENLELLKNLISNDIINSIEVNRQCGNISDDDATQLYLLTQQLYNHVYAHYTEIGGEESMRFILPGAMELPTDKLEIELEKKEQKIQEQNMEMQKQNIEMQKLKEQIAKLQDILNQKALG